jgi:hypothetical protein
MSDSIKLPSKGVNVEWMSQLELLEARIYPLPGASVKRSTLGVDERLIVRDPKDSDEITFLEHVASVRHKPSMRIFVAARETMDALMRRQRDPERFPRWLMQHPVKSTELHIHILEAVANPKPFIASLGKSEEWYQRWLNEVREDWMHETVSYYLLHNRLVREGFYGRAS